MPALTPAKRKRLILIIAVSALLLWVLYVARQALLPFIGGIIAGYIILPLVNFLDRHIVAALRHPRISRALAIFIVYLLVALIIGIIFAFLIPTLNRQFSSLQRSMPVLINRAVDLLTDWLGQYQDRIPINLEQVIADNVTRLSAQIGQTVQEGVKQTLAVVTTTISFIVGIAIIPIWLFYVLLDERKAKKAVLSLVPRDNRQDARNIYVIVDSVLGAYLRGQLILGVSIGIMSTVALIVIGVEPALLLGIMAGFLEMLPYIGPLLALIIAGFIALIQAPIKLLWTVIAFLIIQQLEGNLLVPQIAGNSVRVHPALIMLLILIGNELAGIWGMLLIVPLTAVIRDVVKYLYLRFSDVEVHPHEALAQIQGRPMPVRDPSFDLLPELKEG